MSREPHTDSWFQLRAVLFDLDGTRTGTIPFHLQSR